MLSALLLALREGMEIALILGIVLSALRKTDRHEYVTQVWWGAAAAGIASALAAVLLHSLGTSLEYPAEPIFEGVLMLTAAGLLTWMIFWMQRQARYLRGTIEAEVRRRATAPNRKRQAIFWLAFIAVLREGVELALFLAAAAFTAAPGATVLGALLGLAAAAGLGWALFAAALRLNLNAFFRVTSILLILFAAGLAAHGVHELNEVGLVPPVIEHLWDASPLVSEESLPGALLQTLLGYNANPSLTEALTYMAYLAGVAFALWRARNPRPLASQIA